MVIRLLILDDTKLFPAAACSLPDDHVRYVLPGSFAASPDLPAVLPFRSFLPVALFYYAVTYVLFQWFPLVIYTVHAWFFCLPVTILPPVLLLRFGVRTGCGTLPAVRYPFGLPCPTTVSTTMRLLALPALRLITYRALWDRAHVPARTDRKFVVCLENTFPRLGLKNSLLTFYYVTGYLFACHLYFVVLR